MPRSQHPTGSHICLQGGTARLCGTPRGRGKTPPNPPPLRPPLGCLSHDFCFYCFYSSTEKPSCEATFGGGDTRHGTRHTPSPNSPWTPPGSPPWPCKRVAMVIAVPLLFWGGVHPPNPTPAPSPAGYIEDLGGGGAAVWGSPRVVGTSRAPQCRWAGWAEVGPGDVGLRPSGAAGSWREREDGLGAVLAGRVGFHAAVPPPSPLTCPSITHPSIFIDVRLSILSSIHCSSLLPIHPAVHPLISAQSHPPLSVRPSVQHHRRPILRPIRPPNCPSTSPSIRPHTQPILHPSLPMSDQPSHHPSLRPLVRLSLPTSHLSLPSSFNPSNPTCPPPPPRSQAVPCSVSLAGRWPPALTPRGLPRR